MAKKSIKVLLIEDNTFDARLVKDMLVEVKDTQFDLKYSNQLSIGLKNLQRGEFNIILLDLNLPDSYGLETLHRTIEHEPGLPIVIYSAIDDEETAVEAVKEGAQDYLIKGQTDSNLLTRSIRYAIERKRAQQELLKAREELEKRVEERTAELRRANEELRIEIGERKRSDESLKESEELFRTLIQTAASAILCLSLEGKITEFNEEAELLYGQKREDVIGKDYFELFIPKEIRQEIAADNKKVLKGEPTRGFENTIIRHDGSECVLSWNVNRILDPLGKPVGLIAVGHDITERKRVEEALRKSEGRYRELVENIGDMVYVFNYKGDLKFFNKAVEKQLGYSEEELKNKKFKKQLARKDLGIFELELVNKKGEVRFLEARERVVWDGNRIVEIHGIGRDISERKRIEEALQESEERYRKTLEAIPDMVYELALDGTVLYSNKSSLGKLGYSMDKLGEINMTELVDKNSLDKALSEMNDLIKTKEPSLNKEHNLITSDGNLIPVESSAIILEGKNKSTTILGIARDITDRKLAEAMLKKRAEELEILNKIIINTNKADGLFILFEDILSSTLDLLDFDGGGIYLVDETAGVAEIVLDKGLPYEFVEDTKRVRINEKPYDTVFTKKRPIITNNYAEVNPERSKRWDLLSLVSIPLILKDKVFGALNVASKKRISISQEEVDILQSIASETSTAITRLQAEEMLRESEKKFRSLFESSRDVVYLSSLEGKFVDVNRSGEELFGYTRNELLEIDIFNIYSDPKDRARFQETIKEQGFVKDYEVTFKKKDGTPFECLITSTLRKDKNGFIIGYQGIIRDISKWKRMEENLLRAQKMEALGTLTGGIAHDFNNILTTVLGYTSYLKGKTEKTDFYYEGLDAIERSTLRAADLTSQLLTYTRRGKLEVKPVSINRIVKEAHALITKTFDKSIKIKLNTESNLKTVEGDESQLNQVIMNIAVNAQNAMLKGGTLKIETYMEKVEEIIEKGLFDFKPGDYVCMKFTDTGIGMDEETVKRIFEPYFTTRGDKGGTGLGMSVVFGIVKGHDGNIDIESKPGKGTEITIYLPSSKKKERSLDLTIGEITGGTETVLIIDDEKELLMMAKKLLEESGYNVYTASSGRTGLKTFKEKDIDLVILDIEMPEMGGEEVLEKLFEIDSKVKVLLASGFSEKDQHHDLLEMGAKDFIGKPFQEKKLLRKMREVLE